MAFISSSSPVAQACNVTLENSDGRSSAPPPGVIVSCLFSYESVAQSPSSSLSVSVFIPTGKLNSTRIGDGRQLLAPDWPAGSTRLLAIAVSDFWLNVTLAGTSGGIRWPPVAGVTPKLFLPPLTALLCNTSVAVQIAIAARARSASSTVVSTTTSIASVISVTDATSGMQMSKLTIMQNLASCSDGTMDDQPIGFSGGSYTDMSIGTSTGLYLRGAIVGNMLIAVVLGLGCLTFAAGWAALLVQFPSLRGRLVSSSGVVTFDVAFERTVELIHFPSVLWSLALLLAPTMLTGAIALLQLPVIDSSSVWLALLAIVWNFVYFGYVSHLLLARFQCVLSDNDERRFHSAYRLRNAFTKLWQPHKRWVANPDQVNSSHWKRMHLKIFDGYTISWFAMTDGWFVFSAGVVNGIGGASNSAAVCSTKVGMIAALFIAQTVWAMARAPWPSRISFGYGNGTNVASSISALLVVAYVLQGNAGQTILLDASNWISICVGICTMLRLIGDLLFIFIKFFRETTSAVAAKAADGNAAQPLLVVDVDREMSELLSLNPKAEDAQSAKTSRSAGSIISPTTLAERISCGSDSMSPLEDAALCDDVGPLRPPRGFEDQGRSLLMDIALRRREDAESAPDGTEDDAFDL